MDRDKETLETWNNIAALYQEKFMDMDIYNKSYDYICESIQKPKANLLDVGCGPGNITKYLLEKRPDFKILGIDNAPKMIALARANNPNATFSIMDCRNIGDLGEKYDGIIVGFCLPYLAPNEANNFLEQSYKMLNEKGLIYLSFVEGHPQDAEYKVGKGGRVYFNYYELRQLTEFLSNIGFGSIKPIHIKYKKSSVEYDNHTILTAIKK